MTTKVGNTVIISAEPDQQCTRCKQVSECRDVLGDGEQVCFDCATEAEKNDYCKRLFGDDQAD